MVVVGASSHTVNGNTNQGTAYVFSGSGSSWSQVGELVAGNGALDYNFGNSVSISGNTVVVGALFATVNGNAAQGAAYIFTGSGSTWTQAAELVRVRCRGER